MRVDTRAHQQNVMLVTHLTLISQSIQITSRLVYQRIVLLVIQHPLTGILLCFRIIMIIMFWLVPMPR